MKFGIFSEIQIPKPLDTDDWDPGQEARVINQVLEQMEFADKLGFDYIFEVEHHFSSEYAHSSASDVFLAALAPRTKQIRLGTGIIQMPPAINHPAKVAERIAMLDIVSGGRVEFGTGSGVAEGELTGWGVDIAKKHQMWRESTEECVKMMTQYPYEGFEGKYFSMPSLNIVPKPVQKPHPPLWMAAGRRAASQEAGSLGIGALGHAFESPEELSARVSSYWDEIEACETPLGSAINPAISGTAHMLCRPTTDEAMELGLYDTDFFGYALVRAATRPRDHIARAFAQDQRTAEPKEESERALFRANRRGLGLLIASPEHIRDALRQFETSHVDIFNLLIQVGNRPHELIMESLELFAKEVMPEFKERHPQHQKWREQQLDGIKHPVVSSI